MKAPLLLRIAHRDRCFNAPPTSTGFWISPHPPWAIRRESGYPQPTCRGGWRVRRAPCLFDATAAARLNTREPRFADAATRDGSPARRRRRSRPPGRPAHGRRLDFMHSLGTWMVPEILRTARATRPDAPITLHQGGAGAGGPCAFRATPPSPSSARSRSNPRRRSADLDSPGRLGPGHRSSGRSSPRRLHGPAAAASRRGRPVHRMRPGPGSRLLHRRSDRRRDCLQPRLARSPWGRPPSRAWSPSTRASASRAAAGKKIRSCRCVGAGCVRSAPTRIFPDSA